MEMNVVEAVEFESEKKTEGNSIEKLRKHLGWLVFIWKFTGIPITESKKGNKKDYFLDCFLKFCYPIFLLLSLFYLWYATVKSGGLNYATIIDVILPFLPCAMMLVLILRLKTLRLFLNDLSNISSKNFISHNRILLCCTNIAVCFIFIYPFLIFAMRIAQDNVINVKEVFRILQETIFPCTMIITYASICCLLLNNLQFYKKMFCKEQDFTAIETKNMMKEYLDLIQNIEAFENLFCNMASLLILQDFFIVTVLVIDMMLMDDFMAKVIAEALCELIFSFVSLGIMSFYAGNISLEIAAIKSVLFQKEFNQLHQGVSNTPEKLVTFLLKKYICVLTAGKLFVFDRGFLLKALIFIAIEVVFIFELMYLIL